MSNKPRTTPRGVVSTAEEMREHNLKETKRLIKKHGGNEVKALEEWLGFLKKDAEGHIWTECETERKLIGLRRILTINEELEARRRLKEGKPMRVRLWKEIEVVPVVSLAVVAKAIEDLRIDKLHDDAYLAVIKQSDCDERSFKLGFLQALDSLKEELKLKRRLGVTTEGNSAELPKGKKESEKNEMF